MHPVVSDVADNHINLSFIISKYKALIYLPILQNDHSKNWACVKNMKVIDNK